MRAEDKAKGQLINELEEMDQRIAELEAIGNEHRGVEEELRKQSHDLGERVMEDNSMERRSEPGSIRNQYYSVEFSLKESIFLYQFKIRNISPEGICVLVREDSDLLNYIKAGDILDLKYYKTDSSQSAELKTEIRHIGEDDTGRFKGLYLVGLSILEDQDSEQ